MARESLPDWGDDSLPVPAETSSAYLTPEEGAAIVAAAEANARGLSFGGEVALPTSLVQTWEKEGGFEHCLVEAQASAFALLSIMSDPASFRASFDALLGPIQAKVFDQLRVSRARGRADAVLSAFEQGLTAEEANKFASWLSGLSKQDREAIHFFLNTES